MNKMTVVLGKIGMANQAGNKLTYAALLDAKTKLEQEGEIVVSDGKGQYKAKIHKIWLNVGTLLAEVDKREE